MTTKHTQITTRGSASTPTTPSSRESCTSCSGCPPHTFSAQCSASSFSTAPSGASYGRAKMTCKAPVHWPERGHTDKQSRSWVSKNICINAESIYLWYAESQQSTHIFTGSKSVTFCTSERFLRIRQPPVPAL